MAHTPDSPGSLYLRPTFIGTAPNIGAAATPSATGMLYVITSPVGDYFAGGIRPLTIYIEHDTPRSLKLKVPMCHVPNIVLCLTFLVLHENAWLFVALQTCGLVACCVAQRFPAPWATEAIRAPMTTRSARGKLRATGYVEDAAAAVR